MQGHSSGEGDAGDATEAGLIPRAVRPIPAQNFADALIHVFFFRDRPRPALVAPPQLNDARSERVQSDARSESSLNESTLDAS